MDEMVFPKARTRMLRHLANEFGVDVQIHELERLKLNRTEVNGTGECNKTVVNRTRRVKAPVKYPQQRRSMEQKKKADLTLFDKYILSRQGNTSIECKEVCRSRFADSFDGGFFEVVGDTTVYSCGCDDQEIVISCVGMPFQQCCQGSCPGAECPDEAIGFSCPKSKGCGTKTMIESSMTPDDVVATQVKEGGCSTAGYQEWVMVINAYRCMHDVPPVLWDEDLAFDMNEQYKVAAVMIESNSSTRKAPYGPGADVLYEGEGATPLEAASYWYAGIKACGGFPGCREGSTGDVDDFTTMLWQGGTRVGCFRNKYGLSGCRFKGSDKLTCKTPNHGPDEFYDKNIWPMRKSFLECVDIQKACGFSAPKDADDVDQLVGYGHVGSSGFAPKKVSEGCHKSNPAPVPLPLEVEEEAVPPPRVNITQEPGRGCSKYRG